MTAVNVTRVLGPSVGGLLIGFAGVNVAYSFNAALYVLALAAMMGVNRAPVADPSGHSMLSNMAQGFRYVADNRLVLVLLFFGLVPMFLVMPFQTLLVVFAEDIWEVGPLGLGMLSGASGVGGVVGAAFVVWRSNSSRRLRLMMTSVFAFGLFIDGLRAQSLVLARPSPDPGRVGVPGRLHDAEQHGDSCVDPGLGARPGVRLSDHVVLAADARRGAHQRPG